MLQSNLRLRRRGAFLVQPFKLSRPARLASFWACYLAISALAAAIYVRVVPSPDQSQFDYMAWLDLHGAPFYKGSFDMTWPGQLVFHELGIRIFGVHPWTARATDFLLLQPGVLAIYGYIRRCGFRTGATAAALLYPIIYVTSGPWMTGLRDSTGAHFLIGAAIFALPARKTSRWQPVLAGFLTGYATTIRPTYLAFAPILFVWGLPTWSTARSSLPALAWGASLFGAGLVVAPLLFALYGLANGTLQYWYVDSIRYVFDVYFAPQPLLVVFGRLTKVLLKDLWWLTIAGCTGAVLWLCAGRNLRGLAILVGMAATFVLSYFVQNKAFVYHLAGVIPVMLMLGSSGAEAAFIRPLRSASAANAVGAFCTLLLLSGTTLRIVHARPGSGFWAREAEEPILKTDDAMAVASIVQKESKPDDTFFQWGWQYQVSFLAQRPTASRLINTPTARAIRPGQPIFGGWLTQFDRELTDHAPKFILVDETVITPGTSKFVPPRSGTMLDILERHIRAGYAIRDQRQNTTLLKRLK